MREIIIVGAGASGLVCAVLLARAGREVTLLEHNQKIGRKLAATGNGKCNFTNAYQDRTCYRGENPSIAGNLIKKYGPELFCSFLESLGICAKEKNGYFYPYSEQASALIGAFQAELEHLRVKIKFREHVKKIEPISGGYQVTTASYVYEARRVVLSCGGKASPVHGADGSGYGLAEGLGHRVTPLFPALTGLSCENGNPAKLEGIRIRAAVSLLVDGEAVAREEGELQFTSYGISGIPVFQISRFAGEPVSEHKDVQAAIHFWPELKREEMLNFLLRQKEGYGYRKLALALHAFFDPKLSQNLLESCGLNQRVLLSDVSREDLKALVEKSGDFRIPIKGSHSFERAQATCGGVSLLEVDERTLESKLHKGIFLTGELLDVDGTCGGYNLQWAFTSGYAAALGAGRAFEE